MPRVSVIVPCLNEEQRITQLLEAINTQDFAKQGLEVIIADGLSTDETRVRISGFQQEHPDLKVNIIDNPSRSIPAGLNLAIATASGDIVLRLDAHCVPYPDYISRCIAALEAGHGWNVGGVWEILPGANGWVAEAIALAAAHPLGVGDAHYRFTSRAQEVDTVPFGCFKRSLIDQIGGFDESLQANEDYEFNARIRRAGGTIWLDPVIRSRYFARPNLGALARQYWRYGFWKLRMLCRYPGTLRLRQAAPPLFVLSLVLLPLLSLAFPWLSWVFWVGVVSYVLLLFGASLPKALKHKRMQLIFGIPLAIATMHVSWGAAFLFSALPPKSWRPRDHANG